MPFYQNYGLPLDTQHGATSSCTTLLNTLTSTAGGPQLEEPAIQPLHYFPTPTAQCEASIMSPPAVPYSYGYASNGGGPPYSHMSPSQSTTWTVQSGTDDSVLLGHQGYMSDAPTMGDWGTSTQILQSQPSCLPATHRIANEYNTSAEVLSAPFVQGSPVYTESFHDASMAYVDGDGMIHQARRIPFNAVTTTMTSGMDVYLADLLQYLQPPTGYTQCEYVPMHLPTAWPNAHIAYGSLPGPPLPYVLHHGGTEHREEVPFSDSAADNVPARMVQKHCVDNEGPFPERRQGTLATEFPVYEGYRLLLDQENKCASVTALLHDGGQHSGMALTQNKGYKAFVLEEEILREQESLASIPLAAPGPSTQQSPNRPANRGSSKTARQIPQVAGEGENKPHEGEAALKKSCIACAWPVSPTDDEKPCKKTYTQPHHMLEHVCSVHLRISVRCPRCGAYVRQKLRKHQGTSLCCQVGEESQLSLEIRAWRARRARMALRRQKARRVVHGHELRSTQVQSLVEALRPLIKAGRSRPTDIIDAIDLWMKENDGAEMGWQKRADIKWAE